MTLDKKSLLKKAKYSLRWLPDEAFIKLYYRLRMHRSCDLDNPKSFNEKLQWLKLHDRNPRYTDMVDKIEAKKIAAAVIGEEHIIPTLGVWDSFDEIDFGALPDRFVLKCSHDSEGLVIVKDKSKLDIVAVRKKIESAMRYNFYYIGREWPYKNVKPRILAEEYLDSDAGKESPTDYRVMCFGGKARCVFTCTGRGEGNLSVDFFDTDWNHLPFTRRYPNGSVPPDATKRLKDMLNLAERLSETIPFVRADFYEVAGELYFGELTFYPGSGMEEFDPEDWDAELGSWIELPESVGRGWLIVTNDVVLLAKEAGPASVRSANGLADYKFFCFDGEPKMMFVATDRSKGETKFDFYDLEFNHLDLVQHYPNSANVIEKPKTFDRMVEASRKLSQGLPHVRIDFYEANGQMYFGEYTFYHFSGFQPFEPDAWDQKMGAMLRLPGEVA